MPPTCVPIKCKDEPFLFTVSRLAQEDESMVEAKQDPCTPVRPCHQETSNSNTNQVLRTTTQCL